MLPRRCKKCRCYVAPQLKRCPRCDTVCPTNLVVKPTKEEKAEARVARDEKVPHIHAKNIVWTPSEFAVRVAKGMVEELRRRLDKADTARERNTVRSEIRRNNATLARITAGTPSQRWTSEFFHGKLSTIPIFISPKGFRYVTASKDAPADLIIVSRKKHRKGIPYVRLQRFEKSPHAKAIKKDKQETRVATKRAKVKKGQRAKRRVRRSA